MVRITAGGFSFVARLEKGDGLRGEALDLGYRLGVQEHLFRRGSTESGGRVAVLAREVPVRVMPIGRC